MEDIEDRDYEAEAMRELEEHLAEQSDCKCDLTGTGYCLRRGMDCGECFLNSDYFEEVVNHVRHS